ncbi:TetR/AcrR family transcriptional regulator [Pirellulaceae bacterium]|nr:TetR/AcrR family transcriptional regulator [Pirellulaceae bacterium]
MAQQRLIETAERLFYTEGIHSVGIDRIIAEANVAKMMLCNHFSSKDDLVLAVLQFREEHVDQVFSQSNERNVRKGMSRLEVFFAALKKWFESREFRGCSFINTLVKLSDSDHTASQFSAAHKKRFHAMLQNSPWKRWQTTVAPHLEALLAGLDMF